MSREKKKPKKKVEVWCPQQNLDEYNKWNLPPEYVRCKFCNKRLKVLNRDLEYQDGSIPKEVLKDGYEMVGRDPMFYIPRHKNKRQ